MRTSPHTDTTLLLSIHHQLRAVSRQAKPRTPREQGCVEVGYLPEWRWGTSHVVGVVLSSHISIDLQGKAQQVGTRPEDEAPRGRGAHTATAVLHSGAHNRGLGAPTRAESAPTWAPHIATWKKPPHFMHPIADARRAQWQPLLTHSRAKNNTGSKKPLLQRCPGEHGLLTPWATRKDKG